MRRASGGSVAHFGARLHRCRHVSESRLNNIKSRLFIHRCNPYRHLAALTPLPKSWWDALGWAVSAPVLSCPKEFTVWHFPLTYRHRCLENPLRVSTTSTLFSMTTSPLFLSNQEQWCWQSIDLILIEKSVGVIEQIILVCWMSHPRRLFLVVHLFRKISQCR